MKNPEEKPMSSTPESELEPTPAPAPAPDNRHRFVYPWVIVLSLILLFGIWGCTAGRSASSSSVDSRIRDRYPGPAVVKIELTDQRMSYTESGIITELGEGRVDTLMATMIQLAKSRMEKMEAEGARLFSGVIFNTRKEAVEVSGIFSLPFTLYSGDERKFEVPRGTLLGYVRGLESKWVWDFKQEVPPRTGPFSYAGEIVDFYLKIY